MANTPRLEGRNGRVWQLTIRGWTQERIAEELGITQQRVCQIVATVRESLPADDKAKLRQDTAEIYDDWLAKLAELADGEPIPAYSNGRPIVAEYCQGARGEPACLTCEGSDRHAVKYAEDHSTRVRAIEAGLRVSESKRKMFGVDEPLALTVGADVSDRLAQLAAAAAARLAGHAVPSGASADDTDQGEGAQP
jgi:transcriptional regulator with XRE-family HTH domain